MRGSSKPGPSGVVTLMDLDDLVKSLLELYGHMDIDMQRLIPLRKVYWPA